VKGQFDYEEKVWGAHEVRLSPRYLGALRLEYCLKDLLGVQGRVLEVGCGAGGMARGLKAYRPDLDVYGCDISRAAIAVARRSQAGVTFDIGDAGALPYPDGSFSAVVMLDVLEHLERPEQAIAEARRILRDGGLFHLFVPCEGELSTIHGLLAWAGWKAKERYGGHIQRFTLRRLAAILESEGFALRRRRWSAHLFNQLVDVTYFTGLSLRGKNAASSVEGYLERSKPGLVPGAVRAAKDVIAIASYGESVLLAGVPGAGIHLTCDKAPGGGASTVEGRP
jgi:SAM-dependent methyltransferase